MSIIGPVNPKEGFNFAIIKEELDKVIAATGYKLEREWPSRYQGVDSAMVVLLILVRYGFNVFRSITYLCRDVPRDNAAPLTLSLSVPPLNRTILEVVISLIYLLEDLPHHTRLFFLASWREKKELISKARARYSGRPRWDKYIAQLSEAADQLEIVHNLTPEQKRNPNIIRFWPRTERIIKEISDKNPNAAVLPFIRFLNDWLYRELSAQAHATPPGLLDMGKYFIGGEMKQKITGTEEYEEKFEEKLKEFRNEQIWIAVTLIMSLMSEVEIHFRYGLDQRLSYLWKILGAHSEITEEVFNERYSNLLVKT